MANQTVPRTTPSAAQQPLHQDPPTPNSLPPFPVHQQNHFLTPVAHHMPVHHPPTNRALAFVSPPTFAAHPPPNTNAPTPYSVHTSAELRTPPLLRKLLIATCLLCNKSGLWPLIKTTELLSDKSRTTIPTFRRLLLKMFTLLHRLQIPSHVSRRTRRQTPSGTLTSRRFWVYQPQN